MKSQQLISTILLLSSSFLCFGMDRELIEVKAYGASIQQDFVNIAQRTLNNFQQETSSPIKIIQLPEEKNISVKKNSNYKKHDSQIFLTIPKQLAIDLAQSFIIAEKIFVSQKQHPQEIVKITTKTDVQEILYLKIANLQEELYKMQTLLNISEKKSVTQTTKHEKALQQIFDLSERLKQLNISEATLTIQNKNHTEALQKIQNLVNQNNNDAQIKDTKIEQLEEELNNSKRKLNSSKKKLIAHHKNHTETLERIFDHAQIENNRLIIDPWEILSKIVYSRKNKNDDIIVLNKSDFISKNLIFVLSKYKINQERKKNHETEYTDSELNTFVSNFNTLVKSNYSNISVKMEDHDEFNIIPTTNYIKKYDWHFYCSPEKALENVEYWAHSLDGEKDYEVIITLLQQIRLILENEWKTQRSWFQTKKDNFIELKPYDFLSKKFTLVLNKKTAAFNDVKKKTGYDLDYLISKFDKFMHATVENNHVRTTQLYDTTDTRPEENHIIKNNWRFYCSPQKLLEKLKDWTKAK